MKTPEEIKSQIDAWKSKVSLFDFRPSAALDFLPFEQAKEYLKDGVTAEQWSEFYKEPTRENVVEMMREYMPFALEKASDERGLSAVRSLQKFEAWLWILGDDSMIDMVRNAEGYGTGALKQICDKYGFEVV